MNAAERCTRAANSYYNRGLKKARERDLSGAVPLLKRALELDKYQTDARNLLGLIFYEMGETADALVQWVLSMNLQPEKNAAERYLAEIRRKSGRLAALQQAIERYNSALELAKNGNSDTALQLLSGVVSLHPNYVRAGLLLSLLDMKAGEWRKAERCLRQVLETDRLNPDALRYLEEVRVHLAAEKSSEKRRSAAAKREAEKQRETRDSRRRMTEDDVIIPSTYRESTGWQTIVNIGIGLLIGAAAVLFLYMPAKTAELEQEHNEDLIRVSEQLSNVNASLSDAQKKTVSLTEERDGLQEKLNTEQEGYTYKLSQYQKLIGILNDYRSGDYAHAADLFATIDVSQLTDVDDDSGVSVTEVYNSIAGRMNAEGYLSLYQEGEAAYSAGNYEEAIGFYDKALAINQQYEEALFKKAMSYKQLGDIQNANSLFGEVIMKFPDTSLAQQAQAQRGY